MQAGHLEKHRQWSRVPVGSYSIHPKAVNRDEVGPYISPFLVRIFRLSRYRYTNAAKQTNKCGYIILREIVKRIKLFSLF